MITIDRISRYKQYFLRGHAGWFALTFSLIQFTVIIYELVLRNLFFLKDTPFNHYLIFLAVFTILYFPIAIIIGFLDFRRGTYKGEQKMARELSPIWRDVFAEFKTLREENKHLKQKLDRIEQKIN